MPRSVTSMALRRCAAWASPCACISRRSRSTPRRRKTPPRSACWSGRCSPARWATSLCAVLHATPLNRDDQRCPQSVIASFSPNGDKLARMSIGPDLLALGREHMESAHEFILVGGVLGVISIFASLASRRLGAPVLLVFLVLGMLAGEDGPGGIPYSDFSSAYLIGSVALAVILFEGGLKTPLSMLRIAVWPALALAVVGVGVT